jgi:hypothetical protein
MISDSVLALICVATPLWIVAMTGFIIVVLVAGEKIRKGQENDDGKH